MAKFQPGISGNPNGRPLGSKNSSTRMRERFAKEVPGVMRKVVAAALAGDMQAAKLVLDRVLPPLKAEAATVRLPGVAGAPLGERAMAILVAIVEGRLPPDVGADLLAAMASSVRVIELSLMAARVDALEAGNQPNS